MMMMMIWWLLLALVKITWAYEIRQVFHRFLPIPLWRAKVCAHEKRLPAVPCAVPNVSFVTHRRNDERCHPSSPFGFFLLLSSWRGWRRETDFLLSLCRALSRFPFTSRAKRPIGGPSISVAAAGGWRRVRMVLRRRKGMTGTEAVIIRRRDGIPPRVCVCILSGETGAPSEEMGKYGRVSWSCRRPCKRSCRSSNLAHLPWPARSTTRHTFSWRNLIIGSVEQRKTIYNRISLVSGVAAVAALPGDPAAVHVGVEDRLGQSGQGRRQVRVRGRERRGRRCRRVRHSLHLPRWETHDHYCQPTY